MTHDKLILVYPKELLKDIKELKRNFHTKTATTDQFLIFIHFQEIKKP